MQSLPVFTIGHSVRAIDDFLALLRAHGIRLLADIRTVPRSRRNPQFSDVALAAALSTQGIAYRHFGALGGLRQARADSVNTAFRAAGGLRGYADCMETVAFSHALEELIAAGAHQPTALMCAEANPGDCHRQLTSDALLVRGVPVMHIVKPGLTQPHRLTKHAVVHGSRLSYPAAQKQLL